MGWPALRCVPASYDVNKQKSTPVAEERLRFDFNQYVLPQHVLRSTTPVGGKDCLGGHGCVHRYADDASVRMHCQINVHIIEASRYKRK